MQARSDLYHSYLLRIWRSSQGGDWRATLQDVATHECRHFSTIDELLQYLRLQTPTKEPTRSSSLSLTR